MWENEDDKLKNIMKLKAELEKDLKKRGLLREKKEDSKQSTVDESTMKRLKETVVSAAHISEDKALTTYDINSQDYDASIENVLKTLKTFSARTDNLNKRLIFEGLIKLFNKDLRGAMQSFGQSVSIEARYNYILTKLFLGEDIGNDVATFLKEHPDSIYPLLLLLQNELYRGNLQGISKVLGVLAKRSPFWELVNAVFNGNGNEDYMSRATRERSFSSLIVLLGLYIDRTRDYPIQSHTCLNVHKAILRGETVQCPQWCVVGTLAMEARRYLSGYRIDLEKLRRFEKTPEGALFLGFLFFNENNHAIASEYFKKFNAMIGTYDVYVGHLKHAKVGMEQFVSVPDLKNLQKLPAGTTVAQALKENPNQDVFVTYNNLELVRLVFSEEFCSIVYG